MTIKSADGNKTQGKSTGKDWFPAPTHHHRNLPIANVSSDWTGPDSSSSSSSCSLAGITSSLKECSRLKDLTKLPCVDLGQGQRSLDHNVPPSRPPPNPIAATAPYSSDCKPGYAKNFAVHGPPPPRHASLIGAYGGGGVSYVDWPDCNSPNTKLLDLDSKEVVSSGDRRRSSGAGGGETRRALDLLRCQETSSHPGKDAPGWSQLEGTAVDHSSSSLTLCHLHTHHHTHLVGAAYPIYGSYNGKQDYF